MAQSAKQEPPISLAEGIRKCRKIIGKSMPAILTRYAKEADLQEAGPRFQADVMQVIVSAIALRWDRPKRKRFSALRTEMLRVEKAASNGAEAMRCLQSALDGLKSALDNLTPLYRDAALGNLTPLHRDAVLKALKRPVSPTATRVLLASSLESLSAKANMYSEAFKRLDAGGVGGMLEFRILVEGLARAFQVATGRPAKVTWNEHEKRFEGDFVKLERFTF